MKKFAVIVLGAALIVLMAGSIASAAVTTVESPPGAFTSSWNLFALPAIPVSPAPEMVLDELGADLLDVRQLTRWDAATQSLPRYDQWSPELFGNMLLGDGYWIKLEPGDPTSYSFEGITDNDTTDMWISLPKAGWTLIGHPYSYPTPNPTPPPGGPWHSGTPYMWESVSVTDGTVTKSLFDASQYGSGWLSSTGYWWDNSMQSIRDLGIPDDFPQCETLIAWHGYWIRSYQDNLALIMDAQ